MFNLFDFLFLVLFVLGTKQVYSLRNKKRKMGSKELIVGNYLNLNLFTGIFFVIIFLIYFFQITIDFTNYHDIFVIFTWVALIFYFLFMGLQKRIIYNFGIGSTSAWKWDEVESIYVV